MKYCTILRNGEPNTIVNHVKSLPNKMVYCVKWCTAWNGFLREKVNPNQLRTMWKDILNEMMYCEKSCLQVYSMKWCTVWKGVPHETVYCVKSVPKPIMNQVKRCTQWNDVLWEIVYRCTHWNDVLWDIVYRCTQWNGVLCAMVWWNWPPDFPSLADEIAEPRPDRNIKVAAFTLTKSFFILNEMTNCEK